MVVVMNTVVGVIFGVFVESLCLVKVAIVVVVVVKFGVTECAVVFVIGFVECLR